MSKHHTYFIDLFILVIIGFIASVIEYFIYYVYQLEIVAYIAAIQISLIVWKYKIKFLPISYIFYRDGNNIFFYKMGDWEKNLEFESNANEHQVISVKKIKDGIKIYYKNIGTSNLHYDIELLQSAYGKHSLLQLFSFLQYDRKYKTESWIISYTNKCLKFHFCFLGTQYKTLIYKPSIIPVFMSSILVTTLAIYLVNQFYELDLWYAY